MFALEELDKILSSIGLGGRRRSEQRPSGALKSEELDIEKFEWANPRLYVPGSSLDPPKSNKLPEFLEHYAQKKGSNSISDLLTALLVPLLVEKLQSVPERHFASARLLICDEVTLILLNKIKNHLIEQTSVKETAVRDFLYKPPFRVTAVLPLQELIDLFNRTPEPLVIIKNQFGRRSANYNYPLIKRLLPYLKVVDLFICHSDSKGLDLKTFSFDGSREHQILQFLSNFARTSHLIDVEQVCKHTGLLHPNYNNVAITQSIGSTGDIYLRPNVATLALTAELVVRVASQLELNLTTIQYRAGDPNGLTKVCSNMISTVWKTSNRLANKPSGQETRLLVIDRTFDIQSLLYHSDTYGAFIEQDSALLVANKMESWTGSSDILGTKLRDIALTDVLSTALKFSLDIHKFSRIESQIKPEGQSNRTQQLLSIMSSGNSLRHHLTLIKAVYQTLDEGYLIMLKIELSLEELIDQLRAIPRPLAPEEQGRVVSKIERVTAALVQLTKISGKSIKAMDIVRTACIIVDIINTFALIHGNNSKEYEKTLSSLKSALLLDQRFESEFQTGIRSKLAEVLLEGENESTKLSSLSKLMSGFDRLSKSFCGSKSILKLEQIIERFISRTLDAESFPMIELTPQLETKQTDTTSALSKDRIGVIIVFVGALTSGELARIKTFESKMLQPGKSSVSKGKILVLMSGLCKPENFLDKAL